MPGSDDTPMLPTTEREDALVPLFKKCFQAVRDDLQDSPYIEEGIRVLKVKGYRSAIGNFWNAVVDDLRNKVIHRSMELFNKEVKTVREVKTYEDFQDLVTDDLLIEGAYKIGVLGREAYKILRHAKETRHIFDGHPRSTEPSPIKVLAFMDDCVKYVLNTEYPARIIDLDEFITNLGSTTFDRNEIAVENALGDLPETYKNILANRLFAAYIKAGSPTDLRSNIEFILPILWRTLPKEIKLQIARRVDQEIPKGNGEATSQAFDFIRIAGSLPYLSAMARKYKLKPLIDGLNDNLDTWAEENRITKALEPYAAVVPPELVTAFVWGLTHSYVGFTGGSAQYPRTNFYANGAALIIPGMFESFDDRAAEAFVTCMRESKTLRRRIRNTPTKMRRLRSLGNILLERVSSGFTDRPVLEALGNEEDEEPFFKLIGLRARDDDD